jgi:hypothetical protein
MAQRIKLMAEYGPESLWWDTPEKAGPINPATLPLSQDTVMQLEDWAQQYDNLLDRLDPASSAYFTSEELNEFEEEGINLWRKLQQELLPDYEVVYFSERLRRLLTDSSEPSS